MPSPKPECAGPTAGLPRRTLLAGALLARVAAAAPLRLRLGVDSYTLRAWRWDAIQLLDYAARIGLEAVQFSELPHVARPMEKATDESFLKQVRAHAERLGIRLEMGTWGVCPTSRAFQPKYGAAHEQLGLAIHVASLLGAESVRCVLGNQIERTANGPIERHIETLIGVCRAVRDQALRARVKIAIENHKDLRAGELRYLIEQAGPDYVGVCLDTGNPIPVIEDPLQTVETLAPYAVTSHFRDTALWKDSRGAAFQWVAMGEGNVGIDRVVGEFARRCPEVSLNLEIITGRSPEVLPCLEPDFWKAFEKVKASDLARFLALAERGRPADSGPSGISEAERQRLDLERSVRYCREKLGVRWRS